MIATLKTGDRVDVSKFVTEMQRRWQGSPNDVVPLLREIDFGTEAFNHGYQEGLESVIYEIFDDQSYWMICHHILGPDFKPGPPKLRVISP